MNMEVSVDTENCGMFPFIIDDTSKPLAKLDDGWYRYRVELNNVPLQCNINRYTFMNRYKSTVSLSIKNFYAGTITINETEIVNKEKTYKCEQIIDMINIFDENEEIAWTNVSKGVDHILFQPSRILAYDINPNGYLFFKSEFENKHLNPVMVEMEVLSSYSHWILELFDNKGNIVNKLVIDINDLSMYEWTIIRLPFEKERQGEEYFNSFKIYHDSSSSENFIIRTMAFHHYNPQMDSCLIFEESCCPVKFCDCQIEYETVYVDDNFKIPNDNKRTYNDENNEDNNDFDDNYYDDVFDDEDRNGDVQKRSLLNRIGSFFYNLYN